MLLDGELDIGADLVDRVRAPCRHAAAPAAACVSSEGAVDSIQLVSRMPLEQFASSRLRRSRATSVALTKVLLPEAEQVPLDEEADAKLLIGDAALKSAFEDPTPHYDLGRLWLERTGCRWSSPCGRAPSRSPTGSPSSRTRSSRRCASRVPSPSSSPSRRRALRLSRRLPRALLREAPLPFGPRERAGLYTFLELARDVGELDTVPELRFVAAGESRSREHRRRRPAVAEILEKAYDGERITDEDAVTLLRSRDLVAVGRAANAVRNRMHRPGPRSRSSSTATSTTRTSASPTATSAPSTGDRATARGLPAAEAGDLQEDRGDARDRRHRPPDAGRPSSRTSGSTTTRICSARSRRGTRSTCTRCRRRRSSTSRGGRS